MKIRNLLYLFFLIPYLAYSDGTAGEKAKYESNYIVDLPTAGMLDKNTFSIGSKFISSGGYNLDFELCPYDFVQFGIAYTINNLIGTDNIEFQGVPGFDIKIRPFDEKLNFPALVIGFRTQGSGKYIKSLERFETYSPGVFIVASKNYSWDLGYLGFHGGLNYSLEPKKDKQKLNVFLGIDQTLGKILSIVLEYNANFNEGNNKGLLNLALKAGVSSGITLELQARDLLQNQSPDINRFLGISFINHF